MKLTPKTQDFSPGRKIFVFSDGSYSLSEEMELPSGAVFGAEIPDESGKYVVISTYGSYLISVEGESVVVIPTRWETSSGSYADGVFHLNNNSFVIDGDSTTEDETVFEDGDIRVGLESTRLLDFEDYFIFGFPYLDSNYPTYKAGFLKFDTDFNLLSKIYYDGPKHLNVWYGPSASKEIGGAIVSIHNEKAVLYFDFEAETVTEIATPEAPDDNTNAVVVLDGGIVLIDGVDYISVYHFEDGSLNHLANIEASEEGGLWEDSRILGGYNPHLNVQSDENTIYITEKYRVRAIDKNTWTFLWEKDINQSIGASHSGEQGGTILHDGNFAYSYRENVWISTPGAFGEEGYIGHTVILDRNTGDEIRDIEHIQGLLWNYPQTFINPNEPGYLYIITAFSWVIRLDLDTEEFELAGEDLTYNFTNMEFIPLTDTNNNVFLLRTDNPIMVHSGTVREDFEVGLDVDAYGGPMCPMVVGNEIYYMQNTPPPSILKIGKTEVIV